MFTDAYLGPSRTSAMELFLELFLQKRSLEMFDWVLNTPLVQQTHHAKWGHKIVLFCNIYVIVSSSFLFKNENITLKNI